MTKAHMRHRSVVLFLSALLPLQAQAQTKEYLYVGNTLSGDVSIIEIPAHRVVGTIPASVVGNSPDDIISSRDGKVLYISRLDTKDVIAVSTSTEQQLWRVEMDGTPNHLALSRDERFLYVPIYDKGELAVVDMKTHAVVKRLHGFVVIDLARDSIIKTVALPTLGSAAPVGSLKKSHWVVNHGIGITPDGKHLIANGSLSGFTAIYSLPKLELVGTVPVGQEPNWVVFSRDGKYAYVSNRRDNTLSVIDIGLAKEVTRITVGEFPQRMTVAMAHRGK